MATTQTVDGVEGIYVASPGQMLSASERLSNKIKRKVARGETLSGPFAGGITAAQASQDAKAKAQDARIAALEKQVSDLLKKTGGPAAPAGGA